MSRGFVKEDDLEHAGTDVPERPVSLHANYVTTNGYRQLEMLAETLEKQRVDLSNKKDDQTAMQQLAVVNRDLRYVAARLESALIIQTNDARSNTDNQTVLFGATVTVEDEAGDSHTYTIVGEDEANIKANKISYTSPLGQALIGHKLDESVIWLRPAGNQELTITAIRYI
ncbi:GreA/GreB family elongation factor [Methylotenera versatilis]|uniref:GreA/GreB family elongation factor n=1 Tax=Methylotenera versatilis TaxID=1055487 RepID=UPI000646C2A4|nr:GreA/GreB family elongation factor [Methylotenera versatilis]